LLAITLSLYYTTKQIFLLDVLLQAEHDLMRGVSWYGLQNENEYDDKLSFSDLFTSTLGQTLTSYNCFAPGELILMVIDVELGSMHKAWENSLELVKVRQTCNTNAILLLNEPAKGKNGNPLGAPPNLLSSPK
jgi:hypothetical protein